MCENPKDTGDSRAFQGCPMVCALWLKTSIRSLFKSSLKALGWIGSYPLCLEDVSPCSLEMWRVFLTPGSPQPDTGLGNQQELLMAPEKGRGRDAMSWRAVDSHWPR